MPHIKVKPFDTSLIETKISQSTLLKFRVTAINQGDELWGIVLENKEFLLQVKHYDDSILIKYDKVTRPLKVSLLKKALKYIVNELKLEVISSNISQHKDTYYTSKYEKSIEDFYTASFSFKKVSVEIGFGSGRHLLYQAKKYPNTLFIGLEIHTPSAQQVLKQIELQDLKNIWIVNYDARLFLEMLPSNLLEQIFIHFPVPWDKKPHRRIISLNFLSESMRVLKKEGRLELRTDSKNYFWYALEVFFAIPKTHVEVHKNKALEVTSKYEARWLKMEKDIYDIYVVCNKESQAQQALPDFNFNIVKYGKYLGEGIPKKALVKEDYFVHIERLYKGNDKMLLVKCSFGSFNRPEHKYILLTEEECRYIASSPVKSHANHKAHLKLMELLSNVKCN
ncbi:MAG: tRNA (guanosine(46)-N7)-methyltransferase TrmB [Sulfurovum sp.]|nr:tRNA (guanosine(46)-N7)-methyltransferase TrmB [Sulfurovum sp.]MCB4765770.1 tRNA (guanosine(46)-N7)-methyltransferase TrmB [Sulfurovum sp.]MCB4784424.1 tRNA (guanosine(46)-N7)-methyltransferase TrmB [Sulfurovum sp.]